ncbi:MAG: DUF1524 domain-containing protein [Microbacteriaceae bacterium]|nr:MAG: DUF1524 domain-containing protein [Microbacteriaceae bacterium]
MSRSWREPLVALGLPAAVFVAASVGFVCSVLPGVEPPPAVVQPDGDGQVASPPAGPTATSAPVPDVDDAPTASQEALDLLAALPSAGAPATGYERAAFGPGWRDPDRNGCDARNDILARDLIDVAFRPGTNDCVVASGTLLDPYTGNTIHFVRGNVTSEAVQIDHIVPLAWAWRNGASAWDALTRELFANDPENLRAVDGPTNMAKSDSGPSGWWPPNPEFRCEYAVAFTHVLAKYELAVPEADRRSLRETLERC